MKKVGTFFAITALIVAFGIGDVAAQNIGFKGVGGRLGFVDAKGIDGTIIFGGHVHLGEIIENLVLIPSVDYFSKSSVDFLSINGNVRYYFPTSGNIDLFAGGGLAIVRVSNGASDTELGLNLKGGAEMPLSDNLVGTAELIYVTKGEQIKIMGGITFLLGQ